MEGNDEVENVFRLGRALAQDDAKASERSFANVVRIASMLLAESIKVVSNLEANDSRRVVSQEVLEGGGVHGCGGGRGSES